MNEKLLMKCENTVYADEIICKLEENGIVTRQHNENQNPRAGAYGAITGIAIYVYEKDYEKARALVEPIINSRNTTSPSCPKCGSEEVEPLVHHHNFPHLHLVSTVLICIPVIYICMPGIYGLRSTVADIITLLMVIVGFIIIVVGRHHNDNYKCTECGKKFRHN